MRRALLASALVFVCSLAFGDDQTVRLFLKAKEQFRLAQYDAALVTLDASPPKRRNPATKSTGRSSRRASPSIAAHVLRRSAARTRPGRSSRRF